MTAGNTLLVLVHSLHTQCVDPRTCWKGLWARSAFNRNDTGLRESQAPAEPKSISGMTAADLGLRRYLSRHAPASYVNSLRLCTSFGVLGLFLMPGPFTILLAMSCLVARSFHPNSVPSGANEALNPEADFCFFLILPKVIWLHDTATG